MSLRISLVVFLATFILATNYSCFFKKPVISELDLKLLINSELSSNATKEQVISFLTKHKIAHSGYSQDLQYNYYFNSPKFDGKREGIVGFIIGNIPNIKRTFLLTYELQIFFYFDSKGRLVGSSIKTIGMGF